MYISASGCILYICVDLHCKPPGLTTHFLALTFITVVPFLSGHSFGIVSTSVPAHCDPTAPVEETKPGFTLTNMDQPTICNHHHPRNHYKTSSSFEIKISQYPGEKSLFLHLAQSRCLEFVAEKSASHIICQLEHMTMNWCYMPDKWHVYDAINT